MDAANILKPMLSKGELHCIGATTLEEYRRYIETDSALERRFQQVYVEPPSVEDTKTILRGLKPKYEVHHGVRISDRALVQAAILSDRYITGRFLPDKAIDLVDEAAARLKMEMTSQPKALDDIDKQVVSLKMEIASLKNDQGSTSTQNSDLENKKNELSVLEESRDELTKNWKFEKSEMDQINNLRKLRGYMILHLEQAERQEDIDYAVKIKYSSLRYVEKRIEDAEAKLEEHWTSRNPRLIREEVTELEIAEIVSQWTGIPIIKVQQSERERLMNSEEELHKRVVGQDLAVKAVTKAIKCSREGLSDPNRPIASFMFLGPTGVGKTELAKALACFLFNTEEALVRIDMSEHQEKNSVSRLIGATPGYRSHDAAGQLTEKIRRRPYSVILLDEIEKAHPDILDLLLPILDDGRVTDSYGRTVNFTNTVIIMTSNVGSQQILNTHHDNASHLSDYESVKQRVLKSAGSHFRPEFMNRVDEYIVFQPLEHGQIVDIVKLQVELVKKRIEENHRIKIEVKDGAIQRLAEWGYDPEYGARPVKRVIRQYILNEIAQSILEESFKENDTISIDEDPEALQNKQLSFTKLEVGSTSTSQPTSSEDFISEEIHSEEG